MSRGVKINFVLGGTLQLVPSGEVAGFDAVVQNCTMNFLSRKGADPVFADRGVDLLDRAYRGEMYFSQGARHAVNFASIDTLFFSRAYELADSSDRPARVASDNFSFTPGTLKFRPTVESMDGRTGFSDLTLSL